MQKIPSSEKFVQNECSWIEIECKMNDMYVITRHLVLVDVPDQAHTIWLDNDYIHFVSLIENKIIAEICRLCVCTTYPYVFVSFLIVPKNKINIWTVTIYDDITSQNKINQTYLKDYYCTRFNLFFHLFSSSPKQKNVYKHHELSNFRLLKPAI